MGKASILERNHVITTGKWILISREQNESNERSWNITNTYTIINVKVYLLFACY